MSLYDRTLFCDAYLYNLCSETEQISYSLDGLAIIAVMSYVTISSLCEVEEHASHFALRLVAGQGIPSVPQLTFGMPLHTKRKFSEGATHAR